MKRGQASQFEMDLKEKEISRLRSVHEQEINGLTKERNQLEVSNKILDVSSKPLED